MRKRRVTLSESQLQRIVTKAAKMWLTEGRSPKWTYERCKEVASQCTTKYDFYKKNKSAYYAAKNNGWLDDFFEPTERNTQQYGYWTYERCKEAASKCKTRSEFAKNFRQAYKLSIANNWINEFFSPKINKWTYERCKEAASKCKTRDEFIMKHEIAYRVSVKNGWINEFFPPIERKPYNWTYEKCKDVASKCKTISEFAKINRYAYKVSEKNGWLDDFFPKRISLSESQLQNVVMKAAKRIISEIHKNGKKRLNEGLLGFHGRQLFNDSVITMTLPGNYDDMKYWCSGTRWDFGIGNGERWYNEYLKEYGGHFFVIVRKTDNAKFLLHPESNNFTDSENNPVTIDDVYEGNTEKEERFLNYCKRNNININLDSVINYKNNTDDNQENDTTGTWKGKGFFF